MTTATPAHGWATTKTSTGYAWNVVRTQWDEAAGRARSVTVAKGEACTRARAVAKAKAWVLYFRRGGK